MGPISVHASIDAPRERVFEVICDLGRRPAWTDSFASGYRLARIEAEGVGAAARFKVDAPGGIEYGLRVITAVCAESAESVEPSVTVRRTRSVWPSSAVLTT